jgi:hypothetical protein
MRIEAPVTTGLRFHNDPPGFAPPVSSTTNRPTTVGIEFRGRLIVWHEIPSSPGRPPFPAFGYDPTLTAVYHGAEDRDEAANDLGRFISALVFHYGYVIDPVSPFLLSGTSESDPFHPPGRRELRGYAGTAVESAPLRVEVDDDDRLGLALALYREGANANPYLGFLAFWNVLDAVFDGDSNAVDRFINREAATSVGGIEEYARRVIPGWTPPEDQTMAIYLREHGRNAIGHVVRDRVDRPHINPDDNATRHRLAAEGYWLRAAGRRAILSRWEEPVRLIERD